MARLRPEKPGDAEGIARLLTAAFALPRVPVAARVPTPPWAPVPPEVKLVEELRDSEAWLPELSMVAELDATGAEAAVGDGELVGYALLSRVWVGPEQAPALALGPVAVLPGRQRAGYGTAVVWAALDAAAELGERLVVVLGSPDWYRRFGFRPAVEFGLTSAWSGLGDPWQALVLSSNVVEPARPVPTGEVRYPEPWLRL